MKSKRKKKLTLKKFIRLYAEWHLGASTAKVWDYMRISMREYDHLEDRALRRARKRDW